MAIRDWQMFSIGLVFLEFLSFFVVFFFPVTSVQRNTKKSGKFLGKAIPDLTKTKALEANI
jgi:hypothetical protein